VRSSGDQILSVTRRKTAVLTSVGMQDSVQHKQEFNPDRRKNEMTRSRSRNQASGGTPIEFAENPQWKSRLRMLGSDLLT